MTVRRLINCNFIEEGVYKILEIPEGVNKVVFDRLTNSKVELSRQIKFLTISSSAFDNYEPCQHIIAYGDVWVMEEETETLTACVSNNFKQNCKKMFKKVQVGKDQEKAQSEKDSHSKNQGGKKTN